MKNEALFAHANETVFGSPPECQKALVGYNMSISYFHHLIREAEPVLQMVEMPRNSLATYLENGFQFSDYATFRSFPPETIKAIEECTKNFRERYEPLLRKLRPKAV